MGSERSPYREVGLSASRAIKAPEGRRQRLVERGQEWPDTVRWGHRWAEVVVRRRTVYETARCARCGKPRFMVQGRPCRPGRPPKRGRG